MDCSSAIGRPERAFGAGSRKPNLSDRLRDSLHPAVLFPDRRVKPWPLPAHQASQKARELQSVEALLVPFAGVSARDLAQKLLGQFGTLSRAIAASPSELEAAAGEYREACGLIHAARNLIDSAMHADVQGTYVDTTAMPFLRYIRTRFVNVSQESIHITFCDSSGIYIADEIISRGGPNFASTSVRSLFTRALTLGAGSIVMAHNHPSEYCRPSREDILATDRIRSLGVAFDINLIDHFIITRSKVYSIKRGRSYDL